MIAVAVARKAVRAEGRREVVGVGPKVSRGAAGHVEERDSARLRG